MLYKSISFFGGVLTAFVILNYYISNQNLVNYEEYAIGNGSTIVVDKVNDLQVHGHDFRDLPDCLDSYKIGGFNRPIVLWLGNSQLHTINQYKQNDKTAVAKLHHLLEKLNKYLLALTQPNANFQEHYLLFLHLIDILPVETLILPAVFDDTREDGIRSSLQFAINVPRNREILESSLIGKSIISSENTRNSTGKDTGSKNSSVQEIAENFLDQKLKSSFSIWRERTSMRGDLFAFLYQFRNSLLGIDPTSVRRKIPGLYAKNLNALSEIINLANRKKIEILLYVAPLRNDIQIPYNIDEYSSFKSEIKKLCKNYDNVKFINLDMVVPNKYWGFKNSTNISNEVEIDFMHFKEPGHRLLADAIFAELKDFWSHHQTKTQ
jgi:hypothetical protein